MKHKIYFLISMIALSGCAVELRDRNQQEPQPVVELQVENEYTLPIPLISSEQIVLRYERLILKPHAQLITQGLNVRIEVQELIAEDATIRSFKSDQVASSGDSGRSGGHLELVAERARGNLQILMQGEKGGSGLPGAEPDESLRGSPGAEGRPAIFQGLGGYPILISKAEHGQPGSPGLLGFPGGEGFKGGDSGTALIKIFETEDFQLRIEKKPGRGGEGGLGGAGGPGGNGGPPGRETLAEYQGPPLHTYAMAGPSGAQGPQGPTGKEGPRGYEETSCVQIANENLVCE